MQREGDSEIYKGGLHFGVFIVPVLSTLFMTASILVIVLPFAFLMHQFRSQAGPNLVSVSILPICLVAAFLILVVNLPIWIVVLISYKTSSMQVTRTKLRFKTGFIARSQGELGLEDIETVSLHKPFLGALLGYGTIRVIGNGSTPFIFGYMPNPEMLYQLILKQKQEAKNPSASKKLSPPPHDDSRYMPRN